MRNRNTIPQLYLRTKVIRKFSSIQWIRYFIKKLKSTTQQLLLVNNFAIFSFEKISKLRDVLSTQSIPVVDSLPMVSCCRAEFTGLGRVDSDDLIKILGPGLKSSDLDPFPSTLMKSCINITLPVLKISLQTATMSQHLKEAMVRPNCLKRTPPTLNSILISDLFQI